MKNSIIIITKIVKGRHKTHLRHCLECSGFVEGGREGGSNKILPSCQMHSQFRTSTEGGCRGAWGGGGVEGRVHDFRQRKSKDMHLPCNKIAYQQITLQACGRRGVGWNSLAVTLRFTCTDPMTLRAYQILCEAAVDHHSHCASESNN